MYSTSTTPKGEKNAASSHDVHHPHDDLGSNGHQSQLSNKTIPSNKSVSNNMVNIKNGETLSVSYSLTASTTIQTLLNLTDVTPQNVHNVSHLKKVTAIPSEPAKSQSSASIPSFITGCTTVRPQDKRESSLDTSRKSDGHDHARHNAHNPGLKADKNGKGSESGAQQLFIIPSYIGIQITESPSNISTARANNARPKGRKALSTLASTQSTWFLRSTKTSPSTLNEEIKSDYRTNASIKSTEPTFNFGRPVVTAKSLIIQPSTVQRKEISVSKVDETHQLFHSTPNAANNIFQTNTPSSVYKTKAFTLKPPDVTVDSVPITKEQVINPFSKRGGAKHLFRLKTETEAIIMTEYTQLTKYHTQELMTTIPSSDVKKIEKKGNEDVFSHFTKLKEEPRNSGIGIFPVNISLIVFIITFKTVQF